MLGSGIAMRQICCTTNCRIVVSLTVGGVVQHVRSQCPCSGVCHLSPDDDNDDSEVGKPGFRWIGSCVGAGRWFITSIFILVFCFMCFIRACCAFVIP